jgi:SAM-dependent MidA family methyltransferase
MEVERRIVDVHGPPKDDAGEPELIERLRAEIEAGGPLTFARFMQRALYEPELGYYARSADRPARSGDFLTAPELHPIFGRAVARQLDEMWQLLGRPERFVLREYGAGGGALALSILEELAQPGYVLGQRLRYQPRDLPAQMAAIERRLASVGGADLLESAASDAPLVGCVLANEFIDALPVHRVIRDGGRLREVYVGWREGGFADEHGEPSTDALAQWFADGGIELAEGQRAEVNLAMAEWLTTLAGELERGYVLIIDYGGEPVELYSARRQNGTLRAFRGQHVGGDVLRGVGRQDITAHVDFAALERCAMRAGLRLLGRTTLAEFLLGCGLEGLLAHERERHGQDWEATLLLRSAVGRLLDSRALGGYGVVVLGRDVPDSALSGLSFRLPRT